MNAESQPQSTTGQTEEHKAKTGSSLSSYIMLSNPHSSISPHPHSCISKPQTKAPIVRARSSLLVTKQQRTSFPEAIITKICTTASRIILEAFHRRQQLVESYGSSGRLRTGFLMDIIPPIVVWRLYGDHLARSRNHCGASARPFSGSGVPRNSSFVSPKSPHPPAPKPKKLWDGELFSRASFSSPGIKVFEGDMDFASHFFRRSEDDITGG